MSARGKHRRPRTNNTLTRGILTAGTGGAALAIPLLGATTATAAQPAQVQTHTVTAAPATYTVVKGDTLSKIAKKHSTTGGWKQLYKNNREAIGGNPGLIHPGLKLTLKSTKATTASTSTGATKAAQASAPTYANNLDGWIRQSLDIMAQKGIPGTYDGIYRNIMRESSGNPQAINNWDSNAAAGTPSKGLLQVIDPTFAAYHVPGTVYDPFDPVANITAACNYAAARYGSIDNVFGPY
ncbi:transglycosylase SLT domain-containing protein [Streptomyces sp. NPDC002845]